MKTRGIKRAFKRPNKLELKNIFGAQESDSLTFCIPTSRIALNRDLLKDIQRMKQEAARLRMIYITANQVESLHRVFVINKFYELTAQTHLRYSNPNEYLTFINPVIVGTKGEPVDVQEQCLSIPFINFIVPRYPQISLQYRDQERDYCQETISGYLAQLVQHCISHLDGKLLMDYELSKGRFFVQKDIASSFPKTNFLLKEYSLRLKTHHQKVQKGELKIEDPQWMKTREDYLDRLKDEYQKESKKYAAKKAPPPV